MEKTRDFSSIVCELGQVDHNHCYLPALTTKLQLKFHIYINRFQMNRNFVGVSFHHRIGCPLILSWIVFSGFTLCCFFHSSLILRDMVLETSERIQ